MILGALWLALYLALVAAPLVALLIGPVPPGAGFLWDLSLALGFAGLAMMGVQFFLTARFRRVAAPYGIDIIYYFHRYLAVMALLLLVAHPVLLWVADRSILRLLDPLTAPWYLTAGTIALLAAIAITLVSLLRRRLELEYDHWRVAHTVLAIIAVGLGIGHVLGVGYYTAGTWPRALWIAIGASLIATMVWVRLIRPWRLARAPYRVVEVRPERGDAWTLAVEPVGHPGLHFHPGQFAWLTLRTSPFAMKEHPFSFSSAAPSDQGRLEFTIKEQGDFTRTIRNLSPGDVAYVDGPYGAFSIDRHRTADAFVFIAGGIGIAPIMSMLRALTNRTDRRPVLLLYAYRRWDRMTFREEIETLTTRLALRFVPVLDEPPPEWTGERGWLNRAILDRHLPADRAVPQYFVCGPAAMIDASERLLHGLGVPRWRVHSELFDLV